MSEPLVTPPSTPKPHRLCKSLDSPTSSPQVHGPRNPYSGSSRSAHLFRCARERLGNPKPIEQWLQANMSLWANPDPRSITNIFREDVVCEVEMKWYPARTNPTLPDDPFLDIVVDERFVLYLTITMADSFQGNTVMQHRTSPPIIIDHWDGEKGNIFAPDWCRSLDIGTRIEFTHPRLGVAEFSAQLALSPANQREGMTNRILRWARTASITSQVARLSRTQNEQSKTPPRRTLPRNCKPSRPKSSKIRAGEAANLRRHLAVSSSSSSRK